MPKRYEVLNYYDIEYVLYVVIHKVENAAMNGLYKSIKFYISQGKINVNFT